MKISLKNIGKIDTAEVDIDGITVIAGENDTGKSTVGRALFAVIQSFYHIEEKILDARVQGIKSVIASMGRKESLRKISYAVSFHSEDIVKSILDKKDLLKDDVNLIKEEFYEILSSQDRQVLRDLDSAADSQIFLKIKEYLNITDGDIIQSILERNLDAVFHHQVSNIYTGESGVIQLQADDKIIKLTVKDNVISDITKEVSISNRAVYLDGMLVVQDSLYNILNMNLRKTQDGSLFEMVSDSINVVEEIVTNKKLDNIYRKISSVCRGDLVGSQGLQLGYKLSGSDKILDFNNLSAGLKTFALLKLFLKNDIIESNGTLVLDEPEVHLHPEWQLMFAELIVLIYKEFGVHVLLNTHSPYFLRAIQVYSAKYEAADKCRYYLVQLEGDGARISDTTLEIDKIYRKLSQPLQQLEDERWQNG